MGEVIKHVADDHINWLTPNGLTDEEIGEFQIGMCEVIRYMKYSDGKKKRNAVGCTILRRMSFFGRIRNIMQN